MTSLVSTDEVIARVPAAAKLGATALQLIIDANEVLLRDRDTGSYATNPVTLTIRNIYGRSVVLLPYRFSAISSVVEHWRFADPVSDITLAANDWQLSPQGTALERLEDGDNPQEFFSDDITIVGTVNDLSALRKNVLIQLVAIDVNHTASAGIARQRLGDYEEQKTDSAQNGVTDQKEAILAQLAPHLPVFS